MSRILPIALILGLLVAVASSQGQLSASRIHNCPETIKIIGVPTADQLVTIRAGTNYTVPPGKRFVLTALGNGSADPSQNGVLFIIDGMVEVSAFPAMQAGIAVDPRPVPPGLVATAEQVLSVSGGSAIAHGYILDEDPIGIRIEGTFDPTTAVCIREEDLFEGVYTIPDGVVLIPTAFGIATPEPDEQALVIMMNKPRIGAIPRDMLLGSDHGVVSVLPVPVGARFEPGSSIRLFSNLTLGEGARLWGYFVPE